MMSVCKIYRAGAVSVLALVLSNASMQVSAQQWQPSLTLSGDAGLIDMPNANAFADGTFLGTLSHVGPHTRAQLAFQIAPRLTGVLRYTSSKDMDETAQSVDLRYRLVDENGMIPAIAIGARNMIGNSRDSAEYVVASKTIGSRINVTAGLGWGRLASRGGFSDAIRPSEPHGAFQINPLFEGAAAGFAGVEYAINDSWRVKAEYASDAYQYETTVGTMKAASPMSFGVAYSPSQQFQLNAYSVQGRDFGVSASLILNPNSAYALRGGDPAPLPVAANPSAAASWGQVDANTAKLLANAMENEGLKLHGVEVAGGVMRVRYENTRYQAEAQGLGRLARVLTHVAPADVRRFHLEPVGQGVAKSQVQIQRSDMVALENELGAAERLLERTAITDAAPQGDLTLAPDMGKKFGWSIAPYFKLFSPDPGEDRQAQVGLEASFRYNIRPNIYVSGAMRQRVAGNVEPRAIAPIADYPVVRRDARSYYLSEGPQLEHLTANYFGRAAPNIYTKLTAGYLERMYGGVSGEVLWKPADSRFGLGAELTYAVKRNPEGLSFGDYKTTTGLVSAYYEFDNDFVGRIDAGRYLAGDTGATVSLTREFPNGWQVGGYVTVTDLDNEDGSHNYDRGVKVTVPMDWLIGSPTRASRSIDLGSGGGDAGQRVNTGQELYSLARDAHAKDLADSWGEFWK